MTTDTDPRFARVRTAFASCFADGLEHGSGVAVSLEGKLVVDLWGGHADAARTRSWQRDTLVNVWSVSKAVLAVAVAMMVERGFQATRILADLSGLPRVLMGRWEV